MDAREQRGLEIANRSQIMKEGKAWLVPSQSSNETYTVVDDPAFARCSCPDFELRGKTCKHIHAVRYTIERILNPDGSTTVTETVTIAKRTTYKQNWPAYNEAQTTEKDRFQILLRDLCAGIQEPPQENGRPRIPFRDAVFAAAFKVFSTVSGRRFSCDMRDAHAKGYVSRLPHYNSIFSYLENPQLTTILRGLIVESSKPLKSLETNFAVDSSGFCTSRFERWFDVKYGRETTRREWVKVHLMCGVTTNVVTSVEIADKFAADSPMLGPLVRTTARNFKIAEVSADKGYLSKDNLDIVDTVGGRAYIPYKEGVNLGERPTELWARMYYFYQFNRETFLKHYHRRSNVESTFSMIKAKFGDSVRSKTDVAQTNEALCKILCHNICCLIQSQCELGIEATFWAESSPAQKPELLA